MVYETKASTITGIYKLLHSTLYWTVRPSVPYGALCTVDPNWPPIPTRRRMPSLKITERSLAKLRQTGGPRTEYWDTELKGFGVIQGATGCVFVVRKRVAGKKLKLTIGKAGAPRPDGHKWTATLARKAAFELLGQMSGTGVDPRSPQGSDGPTLADGMKLHIGNMKKKNRSPKSIATIEDEVGRHLKDWLHRPMTEMSGVDLCNIHELHSEAGKEAMANRLVAHISVIWNALDRKHELPGRNPARAVTKNSYVPSRKRLSNEELPAWYEKVLVIEAPRRDFQLFCIFTGMRSLAARTVRWENIDWKEKSLHVPNPKGGEARAFKLPLTPKLIKMLRQRKKENDLLKRGDAGWVFSSTTRSNPKPCHMAEAKERRINEVTGERELYIPGPHVLRRTYLSIATEIGVSELDRHCLANHSFGNASVNASYIAQSFEHLAKEQARIEKNIWAKLKPTKKKATKKAKA